MADYMKGVRICTLASIAGIAACSSGKERLDRDGFSPIYEERAQPRSVEHLAAEAGKGLIEYLTKDKKSCSQ